jgi:hypothetical protein
VCDRIVGCHEFDSLLVPAAGLGPQALVQLAAPTGTDSILLTDGTVLP